MAAAVHTTPMPKGRYKPDGIRNRAGDFFNG